MASADYRLVIGNKTTSSWSLRPWLLMRRFALPFEEIRIDLRAADKKARILAHSPSGKIPALLVGPLTIWDSLAIAEFLAERHREAHIWPADRDARAIARSVSAEMHSGFQALREACPMDFLGRHPRSELPDATADDVRRIVALWGDCRRRFGARGPFLFSEFCAADAMFAPVASRFRTYLPKLAPYGDDGTAAAYVEAIFSCPETAAWELGAAEEVAAARG
jgi:glutathione S-transferase